MNSLVRLIFSAGHWLLRASWFVRRPRTFGAHALAFTTQGKVILVKLRYAPGWRLPGGGRKESEPAHEAVLRELREEIGMTSHGEVIEAAELEQTPDFKRDVASLFIVRDVCYQPHRWNWEIETIIERPLDNLPTDLAPIARAWVEAVRDKV